METISNLFVHSLSYFRNLCHIIMSNPRMRLFGRKQLACMIFYYIYTSIIITINILMSINQY